MDGSGNCYLILKYGNKVVAPMPDRRAIAVGDRSKLAAVLAAVITAAKAGEMDTAIEVAKGEDKKPKRKAALVAPQQHEQPITSVPRCDHHYENASLRVL